MSSFIWPPSGSSGGVNTYANLAAFPSASSAGNGALAIALDTDIMYISNGSSWLAIAGPGSVLSLGAFGSTPNSNGLSLTGNVLNMQPADGSNPGGVSTTTQSFLGQKTFVTGLTGTLTGAASLNILTSAKAQANGVASLDSNALIPINQIPPAALERMVSVADQTARFALTTATVQNGDTVYQIDTSVMYLVIDDTNLGNSSGYQQYSAGYATAALTITTTQVSSNASYFPLMVSSSTNGNQACDLSTGWSFNPSTNTLSTSVLNPAGGSSSLPSIYLTTDTTTGIYRSGVGALGITAVGATVATFGSSGVAVTGALSATTTVTATTQLISSVATGTAPLVVSSTTQVANLNAATAGSATTATTATNAINVATTQVSSNASYFPLMVSSSTNGNQACDLGTGLTFNPSTNNLSTTTFTGALSGNATTATNGFQYLATSNTSVYGGTNSTLSFTGADNLVIGDLAGGSLTTEVGDTLIGRAAGKNITVGTCTAVGAFAFGTGVLTGVDNTAVGFHAGINATSMDSSVIVGSRAVGTGVATGSQNTVVGYKAGENLSSAANNVLIGAVAGNAQTTQAQCVIIGSNAGRVGQVGADSTIVGYNAGRNVTATNSVIMGSSAVSAGIMTGSNNTVLGYNAAVNITSAASAVVIGAGAVNSGVMTGANNTVIGKGAANNLTSANDSVFIGFTSGLQQTSGAYNTFVGSLSGGQNTAMTGGFNAAVGAAAGFAMTTAVNNALLGYQAGVGLTTGHDNTYLGYNVASADTNAISRIVIGSGAASVGGDNSCTVGTASTLLNTFFGNLTAYNLVNGYATTATAGTTTTLTSASKGLQYFTGTTTQTVVLPVTSTLALGQQYVVTNTSTGTVTVQSSGANNILAQGAGTTAIYTVILTSGTTAASWAYVYVGNGGAVTPTITKLTSGSAQTYTTPANVIYIKVRAVGGGGGGAGSGSAAGTAAGDGGNTTFGTSLLTANGGGHGLWASTGGGGGGGTGTVSAPGIGTGLQGGSGGGGSQGFASVAQNFSGGDGASTPFGGAGGGGDQGTAGNAAITNTGSGGGGAGLTATGSTTYSGSGGGAGGYVDAIIVAPSATYTYTVGAAGSAGGAGTGGAAGGAGGSGYIEVTEYYSNGAVGSATSLTGPVSNYTAQTTTYAAAIQDYVNCTSGTFTVTLPTAVNNIGKFITIKNTGTGVITLATTSAQTVDGLASGKIILGTTNDTITVTSDGANWTVTNWGIFAGMSATTSTTGILTGTSLTTVVFSNVIYDPQSCYDNTTGIFTAKYAGKYRVSSGILYNGQSFTGGTLTRLVILRNTSSDLGSGINYVLTTDASAYINGTVSTSVLLAAGGTLQMGARHSEGGTRTLGGVDTANFLTIERVGP